VAPNNISNNASDPPKMESEVVYSQHSKTEKHQKRKTCGSSQTNEH